MASDLSSTSRTRPRSLPKSRSQECLDRRAASAQQQQQQQHGVPWHYRLQQIESLLSEPTILKAVCAFLDHAGSTSPEATRALQQQKLLGSGDGQESHLCRFVSRTQTAQALLELQNIKQLNMNGQQTLDRSLTSLVLPAALKLDCSLRLDLALAMLWSAAKLMLLAEPAPAPSLGLRSPAAILGQVGGNAVGGRAVREHNDPNPYRRAALPFLNSIHALMLTERDFIPLNNLQRSRAGIVEVVRCRLNRKLYVLKSMLKGVARREPHRTSPMTEKELLCLASSSASTSTSSGSKAGEAVRRPDFTPQICAAFQSTGSLHIVMEYFPAGDLNTFLESAGSASMSSAGAGAVPGRNPSGGLLVEDWVKMYAADIVAAVGWVHERGFAHRDIKPSNFLMDYTGHLKLCDFSTAAPISTFDICVDGVEQGKERRVHLFHCREPAGTCDYIAPEILLYEEQRLAAESSWDESCSDEDDQSGCGPSFSVSTSLSMSVSVTAMRSAVQKEPLHRVLESSMIVSGIDENAASRRLNPSKLQPPAVLRVNQSQPVQEAKRSLAKKPLGDCSNTMRANASASAADLDTLPSDTSTEKAFPGGRQPAAGVQMLSPTQVLPASASAKKVTGTADSAPNPNGPGGYGPEVDWWSVGIVIYEMTFGKLPFWARDPAEAFQKIMNHTKCLQLDESVKCSAELRDLIRRLIVPREARLGFHSTDDVKGHALFQGIDWAALHSMDPPFVPTVDRSNAPSDQASEGPSPGQSPSFEQEPSVLHSPSPSVWRSSPAPVPNAPGDKRTAETAHLAQLEASMSMLSIVSPVSFSEMYQGHVDDFPAFVNESERDEELSAMCAEYEGEQREVPPSDRPSKKARVTETPGRGPVATPSSPVSAHKSPRQHTGVDQAEQMTALWHDIDVEWTGFSLQPQAHTFALNPSSVAAASSITATPAPRVNAHKNEVRFAPVPLSSNISELATLPIIEEVDGRSSSAPPAASTPYTRRTSDLSSIASPDPLPSHLTTPYSRLPAGTTMPRSLQRRAVEAAGWARAGIDSRFVTPMRKTSLPNFGMAMSRLSSGADPEAGGVAGGQRSVSSPKAGLPSPYPFPVTASRRTSTGEPAAAMPSRQRSSSQSRGESRSRGATPAAEDQAGPGIPSSTSDSRISGGSITKRDFSEREAWDRMMKAVQKSAKKKRLADDERIAMSGMSGMPSQLTFIRINADDEWSIPGNVVASPPSSQIHQERRRDKYGSMGSSNSDRTDSVAGLPRWSSSTSIRSDGARRQLASYDWRRGELPARTSSRPSLLPDIISPTSKRHLRDRASDADLERSISSSLSMDHSRVPSRQSNASTPPGVHIPPSISTSSMSSTGSMSDLDGEAAQTRWTLRQRRSTRQLLIKAQERTTPSKGSRARGPSLTSQYSLSASDSVGACGLPGTGGGSTRAPKARPASLFGWSSLAADDRGLLSAPPISGTWGLEPRLTRGDIDSLGRPSLSSVRRRSVADFSIKEHRSVTNLRTLEGGGGGGTDVRRKGSHEILREYSHGMIPAKVAGSSAGPALMPKSTSSAQATTDWARAMDDRHLALQRNIDEIEGRISQLRVRLRQEEDERRSALTQLRILTGPGSAGLSLNDSSMHSDRV